MEGSIRTCHHRARQFDNGEGVAVAPRPSFYGVIACFYLHMPKPGYGEKSFGRRMPDSLAGLGVIIIHFSSGLLLRAHDPEAFLDDQMKSLVVPEFFMDRVTERAEGVFCDERQLTSKSVKAKASS